MLPVLGQYWKKGVSIFPLKFQLDSKLYKKTLHPLLMELETCLPSVQQVRTTFILKRRKPYPLVKTHTDPEEKHITSRHYVYDLVENIESRKPVPLEILLVKPVEGLGLPGEIVHVKPNRARNHLLLPKLGVYATKENIEKYSHLKSLNASIDVPSSRFVKQTMHYLSLIVINVSMNKEVPWVVEPWHVKVAFRKTGVVVPETAITLPIKPIAGPDLSIEGKEFYVTIEINKKEKIDVRCRIHHVATDSKFRLPWVEKHWEYAAEAIFPEDKDKLKELALNQPRTIFKKVEADDE